MFITFVIFLYSSEFVLYFSFITVFWINILWTVFFFCVFYRFHVEIMTALNLLSNQGYFLYVTLFMFFFFAIG